MGNSQLIRYLVFGTATCAMAMCWSIAVRAAEVLQNSDFSRRVVMVTDKDQRIDRFGEPGVWFLVDGGTGKGAWTHRNGVACRRQTADEDSAGAVFQYVHDGRTTRGRHILRFDVGWDAADSAFTEEVDLALDVFGWNDDPPNIDPQNSNVDVDGSEDSFEANPRVVNLFSGVANDETPLVLIENNVGRVAGLHRGSGFQTVDVEIDFAEGFEYVAVLFDGEARDGARLEIDNVQFIASEHSTSGFVEPPHRVEFWSHVARPDRSDTVVAAEGPYVEMTNGDRLPALVTGWQPPESEADVGRLSVELRGRLRTARIGRIEEFHVRTDYVRRIVLGASGPNTLPPGQIRFRDGRRAAVSRVVFTSDGIRALGPEGTLSATFDELGEIHLPATDGMDGVLRDVAWKHTFSDGRLVRLQTADGGRMTFPASLVKAAPSRKGEAAMYAVRPHWSPVPLCFSLDDVFLAVALPADEVPLSLLPCRAVDQPAGIHCWPWQRDRNVLGRELRVGDVVAALGFGAHAPARLLIDLPPGAKTFRGRVGLDRTVQDADGCARCYVALPDRQQPLWTSPPLRGADGPVRVGPLDVAGARQLELVAEMAPDEQSSNAAPFDIGDHVDWLCPTVTVDMQQVPLPPEDGWARQMLSVRRRVARERLFNPAYPNYRVPSRRLQGRRAP